MTAAGSFLIIDLSQTPPAIVRAEDVLPAVLLQALDEINQKLGDIMTSQAAGQAQIQTIADGMTAVSDQLNAASSGLAQWIADHQDAPLDFTPALNALASVQAAGGVVAGLQPQAPSDPIQPVPAPPDPAPDPTTPITDPNTPDPSLPPGGDVSVATDPTTGGGTDTGGATDQPTVNPL